MTNTDTTLAAELAEILRDTESEGCDAGWSYLPQARAMLADPRFAALTKPAVPDVREVELGDAPDEITGLKSEVQRQEELVRIYRRAQLIAEEKLCRSETTATGWKKRAAYLEGKLAALTQSPTCCEAERWQPIETAPKNRKVIAGYWNVLGNWRTVTACYHTQLPWADDVEPVDGEEYAPAGWYEESETHETLLPMETPARWQPLSEPPATAIRKGADT